MKKLEIILFGLLILSCQDIENCGTDDNRDFIIVRFFDFETKDPKVVGFTFTAENSPYQFRFLADTTVSTSGDTTIVSDSTFILLPLDPSTSSTRLLFDSDTTSHFIELSYDKEYSIFDPACEPSLIFLNIDTVGYSFDSLSIPGTVTNRQLSTNVEVYF
ncbi:MAG: hypothetical protein RLN88_05915 [Ekhidna sp.]|uniref:hypothetical protein n=1 Tax=Ekhidna sp. TaxID=2608089 RepID=UPI0032EF89C1